MKRFTFLTGMFVILLLMGLFSTSFAGESGRDVDRENPSSLPWYNENLEPPIPSKIHKRPSGIKVRTDSDILDEPFIREGYPNPSNGLSGRAPWISGEA